MPKQISYPIGSMGLVYEHFVFFVVEDSFTSPRWRCLSELGLNPEGVGGVLRTGVSGGRVIRLDP